MISYLKSLVDTPILIVGRLYGDSKYLSGLYLTSGPSLCSNNGANIVGSP